MIKVDRNPIPPASLAIEKEKSKGSYREADVIRQLKELSDPQVEHLYPHYGYTIKERVFDWDNLFYACSHCNNLKKERKYDEKILDCCKTDPEEVLEHIFENGHVSVHSKSTDEKSLMTAELIQNSFEKTNTGIREVACQHRINKLSETMDILYKTLDKYKKQPDLARYQKALKGMLKRNSKFAAFKRYYVREHIEDYPMLEEYIS